LLASKLTRWREKAEDWLAIANFALPPQLFRLPIPTATGSDFKET
jgi:hypothetical protein